MKKSFIVAMFFITSLLLAGCSIIPKKQNVSQEPTMRGSSVEWNEYTNKNLGFSLKVPKISYRFVGFDRTPERVPIPIKVIEDSESDDVYIAEAWTIDREGEKVSDVTLEDLRKQNSVTWKIMIRNVAGEEDIRAFIKKRYYPGCDLSKIVLSKVDGLFDVETTHSSPDAPDQEYCFINWITINKYSPERKLLANWDMGQDANFLNASIEPYDEAMIDSFRFLKK